MNEQKLRREGMAEAVVRIVLARRTPFVTAEDWCRITGLEPTDIRTAIDRMKVDPTTTPELTLPALPKRFIEASPNPRRSRRGNPGKRTRPCNFCAAEVGIGKHWTNHMASRHPGEWEAELERLMVEQYGPECPDCGERIGFDVTVHVQAHTCSAAGAA